MFVSVYAIKTNEITIEICLTASKTIQIKTVDEKIFDENWTKEYAADVVCVTVCVGSDWIASSEYDNLYMSSL